MITVVSGPPRSGTSMVMQMLAAGGMTILTDGVRAPDEFNPLGYLEYEPVKQLSGASAWLDQADGKAVKIVSWHLPQLPPGHRYRVIFMERDLSAVAASQAGMIGDDDATPVDDVEQALANHLAEVLAWLADAPDVEHLRVSYENCVAHPADEAERVGAFVGGPLDVERMAEVVDARLQHHHGSPHVAPVDTGCRDRSADRELLAKQLRSLGYM